MAPLKVRLPAPVLVSPPAPAKIALMVLALVLLAVYDVAVNTPVVPDIPPHPTDPRLTAPTDWLKVAIFNEPPFTVTLPSSGKA